jgi:hypothetical protein
MVVWQPQPYKAISMAEQHTFRYGLIPLHSPTGDLLFLCFSIWVCNAILCPSPVSVGSCFLYVNLFYQHASLVLLSLRNCFCHHENMKYSKFIVIYCKVHLNLSENFSHDHSVYCLANPLFNSM